MIHPSRSPPFESANLDTHPPNSTSTNYIGEFSLFLVRKEKRQMGRKVTVTSALVCVAHDMNFGVEKIDLAAVHFTPELLRTISAPIVHRYRVVPIFEAQDGLCIALADASELEVIDELISILGRPLEVRQAECQQLDTFIQMLYGEDKR